MSIEIIENVSKKLSLNPTKINCDYAVERPACACVQVLQRPIHL